MRRLLAVLLLLPALACAKEATPMAANPEQEARVMDLAAELRCLVCQNQSLADSHSELATDLRREMRGMAEKGMSDKEIVDFMVSRYGDFVLYRPPFNAQTLMLWLGPFLLLLAGGWGLVSYLKARRQTLTANAPLDEAQRKQAEALLRDGGGEA